MSTYGRINFRTYRNYGQKRRADKSYSFYRSGFAAGMKNRNLNMELSKIRVNRYKGAFRRGFFKAKAVGRGRRY